MNRVDASGALAAIREHIGGCREDLGEVRNWDKCGAPADFLLWGKGMGPRCYHHAEVYVGHRALAPGANFALINLADLARDMTIALGPVAA